MSEILLVTLNAKFIHASFGLRYLKANLKELESKSSILEFEISKRPLEIVEEIILNSPKIIGFGVYIWNATETLKVVKLLRQVSPEIKIVLGGPEISYETNEQELTTYADYIVTGEGDLSFYNLCRAIFNSEEISEKIIRAPLPKVEDLKLPYSLYNQDDIENRIIYVEASRGCPFTCEFCLSSLDVPVRSFPLDKLLPEFEILLKKGVKHFKFVDRTFNLNIRTSLEILNFFLERYIPGLFVHFEMVPDRLPNQLRETIAKFPAGSLQFEVGIQTFNPEVGKLISRKQDYEKLGDNIRYIRENTGVHIHADLIAGLPGETIDSFGQGFNRLIELDPQEIQVGILKRLRGTPIIRHDTEWGMVYSKEPPYEILYNKLIDFQTMQRVRRFARFWDIVANSGNFVTTVKLLWSKDNKPFVAFMNFSDWLYKEVGERHGIALVKVTRYLWRYLTEVLSVPAEVAAAALYDDYNRCSRKDLPDEISSNLNSNEKKLSSTKVELESPPLKRQLRHLSDATKHTNG